MQFNDKYKCLMIFISHDKID